MSLPIRTLLALAGWLAGGADTGAGLVSGYGRA